MGWNMPIDKYPDPLPTDGSMTKLTRPLPKRRQLDLEGTIPYANIFVDLKQSNE